MIKYPWPHAVLDDFYDTSLFNKAKKEIKNKIANDERLLNRIKDTSYQGVEKYDSFETLPITKELFNSVDILPFLKIFNKKKYSRIENHINITLPGRSYRIHDEQREKVISLVTYLMPENNQGTRLYTPDKQFVKEVEWKPNRCMIFAGIKNTTWHNFQTDKDKLRVTLNTFFIDDSLK